MIQFFKNIIQQVEESKYPLYYYLFIFLFSVNTRNLLEVLSYREFSLNDFYPHLHYTAYYVAIVLASVSLLHLLLKRDIIKVLKVNLTFIPAIILCPVVDIILFLGFEIDQTLGYLSPEIHGELLPYFFTFFGNHVGANMGPSIGYRIEVFSVLAFMTLYVFTVTQSVIKAVISFILMYCLIFFFCSTPYLLVNLPWKYSTQLVPYYMLISLFLLIFTFHRARPDLSKIIWKDSRPFRMMFYQLLFLSGVFFGLWKGGKIQGPALFMAVFVVISIGFAWIFSVITNNITDVSIDKLSNPNRPLITKSIDSKTYMSIAWVCLSLSLLFALQAHTLFFLLALVFITNYFIYSHPPIRLKRYLLISKIPIALNILCLFSAGVIYTGTPENALGFYDISFIFIGGMLAANIIDLKDTIGDKADNVSTLPNLIGIRNAKIVLSLVLFAIYAMSFPYFKNDKFYYTAIVIGIFQLWLINRKNYKDVFVIILVVITLLLSLFDKLA
jgi:4-hydroxybenzoate polyprenyltransferase